MATGSGTWAERVTRLWKISARKVGTLLLSLVAMILCPTIPVVIEWLSKAEVKRESYLITAAVMSTGLFVSAEHHIYRACYAVLFILTLILDILVLDGTPRSGMDAHAGQLLLTVVGLHFAERFQWHVVYDRPFPDIVR